MAINIPYHSSVEPIVPDAQHNIAPELISRGMAALGQMALAREKMQLESEQMATDAALKSQQLKIERQNNLLDFQVGMRNADSLQQSRIDNLTYKQRALEETILHHTAIENIQNDTKNPLSLAGRARAALLKEQDFATFANEAAPLMDDPNPKNPVDYYEKVQRLHDTWQFSNDTRVRNALKQLNLRTEQHTVPLRQGHFDEDGSFVASGVTKATPVGQIVENLSDPTTAEKTMQLLEANNLIEKQSPHETGVDVTGTKERSWLTGWMLGKPTQKQTVTETTLAPSISRYAKMAAGVDFSRGKPRTPAASVAATDTSTLPASRDGQQEVTTRDVGDATARMQSEQSPDSKSDPLFPETDTEKTLRNAADFVSQNPGRVNIDGLKAKLQSMGIDPNLLDEELAKRK